MKIKNTESYQQYTAKKAYEKDMILVARGLRKIPGLNTKIVIATLLANLKTRELFRTTG